MANNQIALMAQAPVFDTPFETQGKALQLQNLMHQSQANQMDMQQRQQSLADMASQRQALMQDPTGGQGYIDAIARSGNVPGYQTAKKAQLDAGETLAKTGHLTAQTAESNGKALNQAFATHRDQITTVNTRPDAVEWVRSAFSDPLMAPVLNRIGTQEQAISKIPTDPAAFQQWKVQAGLAADEYVKHTSVDANTKANNDTSIATNAATNATSVENSKRTQAGENSRAALSRSTQLTINGMDKNGAPSGDVESMAQGIAAGKLNPINGFALAKPRGQAIMARVMEINPSFDAGDTAAKNAALKSFSTGKEGSALRSFSVAGEHLDQLSGLVKALDNGNTQLINKYGNKIAEQTGSTAPTNFDAAKGIVAKEVVKAIVAGGGGVSEREELAHLLDNAKSPKQLDGVISTYKNLMDAQRSGLIDQYHRTTGRSDGDKVFGGSSRPTQQTASIPTGAADMLKSNPSLRAQFEQKYGAGSADAILGK